MRKQVSNLTLFTSALNSLTHGGGGKGGRSLRHVDYLSCTIKKMEKNLEKIPKPQFGQKRPNAEN